MPLTYFRSTFNLRVNSANPSISGHWRLTKSYAPANLALSKASSPRAVRAMIRHSGCCLWSAWINPIPSSSPNFGSSRERSITAKSNDWERSSWAFSSVPAVSITSSGTRDRFAASLRSLNWSSVSSTMSNRIIMSSSGPSPSVMRKCVPFSDFLYGLSVPTPRRFCAVPTLRSVLDDIFDKLNVTVVRDELSAGER